MVCDTQVFEHACRCPGSLESKHDGQSGGHRSGVAARIQPVLQESSGTDAAGQQHLCSAPAHLPHGGLAAVPRSILEVRCSEQVATVIIIAPCGLTGKEADVHLPHGRPAPCLPAFSRCASHSAPWLVASIMNAALYACFPALPECSLWQHFCNTSGSQGGGHWQVTAPARLMPCEISILGPALSCCPAEIPR